MNITTWLLLICSALALAALAWFVSAWWYGRKLVDLQQRLDKVRHAANQQSAASRHQITVLQKELAERPPLSKSQRAVRDEAAEAAARKQALEASLDQAATPRAPANGFADTQPLSVPPTNLAR
ncbi:hypothetical protein [uncultured Methylibium sp.]|uniref:hypothetical protein n=1 Tax=uncultured Methylibium sp. TaxID=381093 RepID=UPI0026009A5F|nr:hypothetical protein [uncultured Methylibium sp.]